MTTEEVDLIVKAKETGRLKFWTMVFYEINKLEAEQGLEADAYLAGRYQYLQSLRGNSTGIYYGLMTIRGKGDEDLADLISLVERIVKKKWLKDNCMWVYEQKGECDEDAGRGAHCHILFKLHGIKHGSKQKSKVQCINEIVEMTKKLDWIEEQGVDLRTMPKKDYEKVKGYITGAKASEEKHEAQKIDILWREKQGLLPRYGVTELP